MIKNLSDFFSPEQEIYLENIQYQKIEKKTLECKYALLCNDRINVSVEEDGVRIVFSRSLQFEPEGIFSLSVSYGAELRYIDSNNVPDWKDTNLAEEFKDNGDFIMIQLMSRVSLLIGQITSSFGQHPLILPPQTANKKEGNKK